MGRQCRTAMATPQGSIFMLHYHLRVNFSSQGHLLIQDDRQEKEGQTAPSKEPFQTSHLALLLISHWPGLESWPYIATREAGKCSFSAGWQHTLLKTRVVLLRRKGSYGYWYGRLAVFKSHPAGKWRGQDSNLASALIAYDPPQATAPFLPSPCSSVMLPVSQRTKYPVKKATGAL